MFDFIRRLFSPKPQTPKVEMATTAPLTEQQIQSIVNSTAVRFDLQQLVAACGQSVGKQRELNEDSLLAITSTLAGNSGNIPFGLYVVADGMGGHQLAKWPATRRSAPWRDT